jgi:hypothetical protein
VASKCAVMDVSCGVVARRVSVKSCFLRWEVLLKIWFAGFFAVFLVTLAWCGSCVADFVLDRAEACAWRVCAV